MSEEVKKSAFKLFAQAQMSYAEAEEKAKSEAGKPKVDRFRTGEDGEYSVRILPLAPEIDAEGNALPLERKGYEYPVHQLFLGITLPGKKDKDGKKAKTINIPVVRATDKGVDKSVDLIDTYVKIAKELYADDADLLEKITGNSYGGGLRWSYQHAIYVIDLSTEKSRAKGPQLWQCSHSQYKSIDEAKMRLWTELRADGGQETCPISWFTDAYPIKIIRKTEKKKTEYTFEIGRKCVDVTEEEVEKLLSLPRIPEQVNRFTRYQLEAEIVFLQQYDEKYDMEVCKEPDFLEAVEKLKGEMPADDTSHFDLAKADSEKEGATVKVTIDSLWAEYDKIVDAGLSEKSDEYQELREKIRQFVEENDLDVRLARSKNNKQLLEEVEDALDAAAGQTTTSKADDEPVDDEEEDNKGKAAPAKEDEPEDAPAPSERRRRPRPNAEEKAEDKDEDKASEDKSSEESAPAKEETAEENTEEARPLHRRRRRS